MRAHVTKPQQQRGFLAGTAIWLIHDRLAPFELDVSPTFDTLH